jgi:hypothetical protein
VDLVLERAGDHGDDDVPPIVRCLGDRVGLEVAVPRLVDQVVDEIIRGLLGPDRMEEQAHGLGPVAGAVLTGRVSAVVHTRPVRRPGHGEELRVANDIGQVLAGRELAEVPGVPVRAGIRLGVGHQVALGTRHDRVAADIAEGDGTVLRERIRIEEDGELVVERIRDVHDRLIEQARVALDEVPVVRLERHVAAVEPFEVPEIGESLLDRLACRDRLEEWEAERVLGLDPRPGLLGVELLEPAVGIGHRGAEEVLHEVLPRSLGVGRSQGPALARLLGRLRRPATDDEEREEQDRGGYAWDC